MLEMKLDSNPAQIEGTITGVDYTNTEVNERPVMQYFYTFVSPEIGEWYGYSYSSTSTADVGDRVTILYNSTDPSISKIRGMDTSSGGFFFGVLFPLFFVVPLLIAWIIFLRRALFKLKVLRKGSLTEGVLIDKKATATEINNQRVYALTFEYEVGSTKYTRVTKTHEINELMDDPKELMIYHYDYPSKAIVVDALPRSVGRYIRKNWS